MTILLFSCIMAVMKNRLSKILAQCGVASRRACEKLIFDGKVTVNGSIIVEPQTHVSVAEDDIRVDGHKVRKQEDKKYFILNKPHGYTCSHTRIGRKKLVYDIFERESERLFTVGRLDRDTTGLLLVTNDGHFANQVIHPRANISKEYVVKTTSEITDEHLKRIGKGTLIEGIWIKPQKVTKVRKGTLKIVVKEGKKREVRLLVQNAGLDILSLARTRIGGLRLGDLPEGAYREMSEVEKEILFN